MCRLNVLSGSFEMADFDKPENVQIVMVSLCALLMCCQFLKLGGTALKLREDVLHGCSLC